MPGYSSSEDEFQVIDILKQLGLRRKYGKLFEKSGIEDLDDAMQLSERRLRKMGITSSSHRRKIMNAIWEACDSESSSSITSSESESESEEDISEVEQTLRDKGFDNEDLFSFLRKRGISTTRQLRNYSLTEQRLKSIGMKSSRQRQKLMEFVSGKKLRRRRSSGSSKGSKSSRSSSDSKSSEKEIIKEILEAEGFPDAFQTLKRNGVKSIKQCRELTATRLREFGVDSVAARSAIISAFTNSPNAKAILKKHNLHEDSSESESEESDTDTNNPLKRALRRVKLEKLFTHFKKRGISNASIRTLQDLGDEELKDLGIMNMGQRQLVLEAIAEADWKCCNCGTWNEQRKLCMICHKAIVRKGVHDDEHNKFLLDQKVKYVGKYRQATKLKSGEKGKVDRILADQFYVVKFSSRKDKKTVLIRLNQRELVGC